MTKGGRAARSRESAYQRERAPAAKTTGTSKAAANGVLRERPLIHAFARPPASEGRMARAGMATSASNAASNEFLTMNAPGSLIPLARNASFSRSSARASNARFEVNAKASAITTASIAHQTPPTTDNPTDRVRAQATDPATQNSASVKSIWPAPRTSAIRPLSGTNDSIYVVCNACRT